MGEWKEITLADLCTDISYGYTESAKQEKVGPKFLRITDIASGRLEWENVPYCPINESDFEKYKLLPGDIVIARTGATTGANYTINESDPKDVVFASYLIRYKINSQIANPYYIGQLLQSPNWSDYVDAIAGGSAQPGANAKQLGSFEILLPPLPEQRAIASILSSLDDKIDLLHRQNATLEKMAETLFRQWFVEEAKEEWENCVLEDLCSQINSGGTPSTKIETYYNGNINWYSTKELNDNYLFESISKITQDGLENSAAKLFPKGTVLIAIYAAPTVGRLGILGNQSAFNQAACGLIANDKICCKEFIYLYLKNQRNELNAMASGSAQQNLNVGKIKTYPAFIPDDITMNKFKREIIPFFEKIEKNAMQIRTIKALRDTLLPKLMSGEVRVEPD
jgi:type I restriction enzyme S subunit